MTITIPTWLLYVLYAVGGFAALAIVLAVVFFALLGVMFVANWRPPSW